MWCFEQVRFHWVECLILQAMKASYRILLCGCAGFVVGFAVGHGWQPDADDQSEATSATVVELVLPSATHAAASNEQAPLFGSRPELPTQKFYPAIPAERWTVTIWHPTIPPQKADTFDPLELAARRMGITNRQASN